MARRPKQESPERGQTDDSLRSERKRADSALTAKYEAAEDNADAVLRHARENADAVLQAARHRADDRDSHPTPPAIVEQRLVEDQALSDERGIADDALRKERLEIARAFESLLPLERETTDRHLRTERVRSDDALSNRDDFLGMVTHDLRDLLGGIVLSAEVLAKMAEPAGEGAPALLQTRRIQRYAARMNRLIGDLLDVTAIDAGKLSVTPASGHFEKLVAEALETFGAVASAKGIALKSGTFDGSLPAQFDHDRLLQVLANLITNAIKFTPSGGTVTLDFAVAGKQLQFSIRDTGVGIPNGMLEAVFERFRQVSGDAQRGLGLGLYISRCIIEAHGGRIWAEGGSGVGAAITFTLPLDVRPGIRPTQ